MSHNLRTRELTLLILPFAFLALGMVLLDMTLPRAVEQAHVVGAVAVAVLLLATHVVLIWRCRQADPFLLPLVAMLAAIGLVMVARLEPEAGAKQALWVSMGLVILMGTVVFLPDVALLQSYRYTSAILGLLLVAATFVLGEDPNGSGARLWLVVGGIYLQPSEILKVLLVVFLAGYLEDKRELLAWSSSRLGWLRLPPLPYLGPLALMWGVSMLLLVAQRDLGATLLFFGVFLAMLYVASSRIVYALGGLVAFLAGVYGCYLAFSHVRLRVELWLDPWSRAADQGYQVVQALVALASGGLLGSGLGQGYPGYVPAVYTDFIIVAIGEEMGLAGALAVVALFMLLVYRGFRIALDARGGFHALLAAGLSSVLGLQSVVILAGASKLIPITGITLPFVSYGGSSVITNFLIVGLLLRISAEGRPAEAPMEGG